MIILGFLHGHDGGSSLVINGEIIVSISEERLNRQKKNIPAFLTYPPIQSMLYCVHAANITLDDVDLFVFNETEHGRDIIDFIHYTFGIEKDKFKYITHHDAHIYSTFLTSPFKETNIVVADGAGEDVLTYTGAWDYLISRGYDLVDTTNTGINYTEGWTISYVNGHDIVDIEKKWIQTNSDTWDYIDEVSIGLFYDNAAWQLVSNYLNWPSAGKVMGLASYADKDWVKNQELSYSIEDDNLYIPNKKLHPEVTIDSEFQEKANVAGLYQRTQEETTMFLVEKAKKGEECDNLCVVGGSFLNCNTNYNILTSGLYENVHLFPALDDTGISLGCALWGAFKYDKIVKKDFFNPYLGREYSDMEMFNALNSENKVTYTEYGNEGLLIKRVCELLNDDKVIGWFQGGSEIGPRALGNRSILASPRPDWMRDHINHNVKLREWYRPFAPAVLYERQKDIFDFDYFSPYMLVTAEVKEEWRDKIPAVTHHDNTARYQSVTPETNNKFYNLIKEFDNLTGIPVLLNTSFNGPKEPIVETPEDAIRSFLELEIDYLVMDNFVIQKKPLSLSYDNKRMDKNIKGEPEGINHQG